MVDGRTLDLDPVRRTALRLYTMSFSDRTWILAQLDAAIRGELANALSELENRKLPRTSALYDEIVEERMELQGAKESSASLDPELRAALHVIDSADVACVQAVLSHEEDWVIFTVLGFRDWRWKASYVKGPGKSRCKGRLQDHGIKITAQAKLSVLEEFAACITRRQHGINSDDKFEQIFASFAKKPERLKRRRSWWKRIWAR